MKSLLEEQKRMQELMNFTYGSNSHDVLSEEIINKQLLRTKKEYKKPIISEVDTFDWEKDLLLLEADESLNDGVEFGDDIADTPEFEEFMKELIAPNVSGTKVNDTQSMDKLVGKKILTADEESGSFGYLTITKVGEVNTQTSGNTQTNESLDLINERIKPREWNYEEYWKDMICQKGSNCVWQQSGGSLFIYKNMRYKSDPAYLCRCSRKNFCCGLSKVLVWLWRRVVDVAMLPTMLVWTGGVGLWKGIVALAKGAKKAVQWIKKKFKQWFRKRPKKYKHFVRVYVDKKGKGDWKGSKFKFGVRRYVTIGKSENGKEVFIDKRGDEAGKVGIPPEQWDQYIKDNQNEIVQKMDAYSKENWQKLLAEPDDPNDNREDGNKEYAVYVIQQYLKGAKDYKWKYVRVGDLSWMKDIEEPKEEDPGNNIELDFSYPEQGNGSKLYVDNEWGLTANLTGVVNAIATKINKQLQKMNGVNWKDGWKAHIDEIMIESSASRFRNSGAAKDLTFAELAEKRMETAENYILETLKKLDPEGNNKVVVIDGATKIVKKWEGSNGDGTSGPNPPGIETEYILVADDASGKKLGKPYITFAEMKASKKWKKFKKSNLKYRSIFNKQGELVSGATLDHESFYQPNPFNFVPKGNFKMEDYANCPLGDKDCFSYETETQTSRGECGTPHASKEAYDQYKYTNISIKVTFNGMEEKPDDPVEDPGKVEIISGGRYPVTFVSPPKGGIRLPILGMQLKIRWKPPKGGGGVAVSKGKKTKGCPEAYGNKD